MNMHEQCLGFTPRTVPLTLIHMAAILQDKQTLDGRYQLLRIDNLTQNPVQ